jgi:hypothetical protein
LSSPVLDRIERLIGSDWKQDTKTSNENIEILQQVLDKRDFTGRPHADLKRRNHGSHADARVRRQAAAHRQEDPAASVHLRHQPPLSGDQQWFRASISSLPVFRKITNGCCTKWGAKLYANIRSVIETARCRAVGVLVAIGLTLAGMPLPNLA